MLQHALGIDSQWLHDRLRRFQRETADEHRERTKHRPRIARQQSVTPCYGRAQRLVAHRSVARPTRQEQQALIETRLDGRERRTLVAAAASSIANGSPSRRMQMSLTTS